MTKKIISTLMLIVGLGCLLFPFFSNYENSLRTKYTVNHYDKIVTEHEDYREELKLCREYNRRLLGNPNRFKPSRSELNEYYARADIAEGMIGYVEIPKINVKQPIYHSTTDAVLSYGVGHMIGSSLPVGGLGTHAVLSGHTGMAAKLMFTNLTAMEKGDRFYITVMNETHVYEIDQILKVLPHESAELRIYPNKNYVTLITCVPIGINSHRLLVRGVCVESTSRASVESEIKNTPHTFTRYDKANWLLIGLVLVVCLFLVIALVKKQSKKRDKEDLRIEKGEENTYIVYEKGEKQ